MLTEIDVAVAVMPPADASVPYGAGKLGLMHASPGTKMGSPFPSGSHATSGRSTLHPSGSTGRSFQNIV